MWTRVSTSCACSETAQTWATYDYADASGEWQSEVLLESTQRAGTHPSTQWNSLKIIARSHQLWFIANGVVLGSASQEQIQGHVSIQVTNWDDADAEFEFKNLIIRAVSQQHALTKFRHPAPCARVLRLRTVKVTVVF